MKTSKHHLFTYYEVRKKLVQIWGEPQSSEDHEKLHNEIKCIRKIMPIYEIDNELHIKIHKEENNGRTI